MSKGRKNCYPHSKVGLRMADGGFAESMGQYWSRDNAEFDATKPSTLQRIGRQINPLTNIGSAVGSMYDAAATGSVGNMALTAVTAFPALGTAGKLLKTTLGVGANSAVGATLDERMPSGAGVGMADGGTYHKGSLHGGRVVGPGGPVDDKVDAKYSAGEYVLPTDTAQAIGYENLDAIKDATHMPANLQKRGLRMADGGRAPSLDNTFPNNQKPKTIAEMYAGQPTLRDMTQSGPQARTEGSGWRTESVLAGAGEDAMANFNKGETLRGIGSIARGVAGAIPAAFVDVGEDLFNDVKPVASGIGNLGRGLLGINDAEAKPAVGVSTPAAPAAPAVGVTPTSAAPAAAPVAASPVSLRGGLDMGSPNANLRQSVRGLADGQSVNVGRPGGDTILASRDAKGQLSLSGTGDGSASRAYEQSDQYRQGLQVAARERALLDTMQEDRMKRDLTSRYKGDRVAAAQQLGLRAKNRETDATLATTQATLRAQQAKLVQDQNNADRTFNASRQDASIRNRAEREGALQKRLETYNTRTVDGKDEVNRQAIAEQTRGINRALARQNLRMDDLDDADTEALVAASRLLSKVQQDGSNFNPFKPDFLKTSDPSDLIGMRRNADGDAVLPNGDVIPGRYIDKVMSELVMPGTPTTEFNILFRK